MLKSLQALISTMMNTADRNGVSINMPAVVLVSGHDGVYRVHDVVWNGEQRRWEVRVSEE